MSAAVQLAEQVAARLMARAGDWPLASPDALTAAQTFQTMLQATDGSTEAAAYCRAFSDAGCLRAVVAVLEETSEHIGRVARTIAPYGFGTNMSMTPEVRRTPVLALLVLELGFGTTQTLTLTTDPGAPPNQVRRMLMLADVQTMGVTLLSNFAAVSEGSRLDAGAGGIPEELRVSKAVASVVRSIGLYPESPEHVDACLAALSQLLPLDPAAVLTTGAVPALVAAMESENATPWQLYLGARALARFAEQGATERQALCDGGGREALLCACRAPPGAPECGAEWGVQDVPAKLQGVARAALASLAGTEAGGAAAVSGAGGAGGGFGGRAADGTLGVSLFVLHDAVVMAELEHDATELAPELNGGLGVVVGAGEHGIGPEPGDGSGEHGVTHGVKVAFPLARRGDVVRVKPANLRLKLQEEAVAREPA